MSTEPGSTRSRSPRTSPSTARSTACATRPRPSSEAQQVGDLYASFLDEETIEQLGAAPIADSLAVVAGVGDLAGFVRALGALDRAGVSGPFGYFVNGDAKASDRYIMYLNQAGLGLPDESYYREDTFAEIRTEYLGHLA